MFENLEIFLSFHKMEAIDEHLLIVDIEISCWKDQLRQAVSQSYITDFFYLFQSTSV